MSKVIEFRRADMAEASDLSTVRLQRQDSLVGKADGEAVADAAVDHHWRVALALASWPICLGAGAVLLAL